jgi:hypothetical protein
MGDPRELEWAKKPDALKESWTARIGTHMVHGVSPYRTEPDFQTLVKEQAELDVFLMETLETNCICTS